MAFLIVSVYFLKFWKRTRDRLFLYFSAAFFLFMLHQVIFEVSGGMGSDHEKNAYTYVLRILGYCLIAFAIIDKNTPSRQDRS